MNSPQTIESHVPATAGTFSIDPQWRQNWLAVITHTHTWSGRPDHGGTVMPPDNYTNLARWCREHDIDALGMGSPYTPRSAGLYRQYDVESPESYFQQPELHGKLLREQQLEVMTMLDAANAIAHGHTTFYLDNETPKGRYGHLWWINHKPDFAAWHDYDQPFDRWMCHHEDAPDGRDEPMAYQRRPYRQIVAEQRHEGAVGIWAHPTSWWYSSSDGRFITNLATEMPAHGFADGFLDGMVVMGYHADRPEYRALWFALLDRGIRIPAMAEMDMSLSDERLLERRRVYRSFIHSGESQVQSPLESQLADGVRRGRVVCSTGPMMTLEVDGMTLGESATTSRRHTHRATLQLEPTSDGRPWDRVELVGRGGKVLAEAHAFAGGTLELSWQGDGQQGYVVAMALSKLDEQRGRHRDVVITSPIYLLPRGASARKAMTTQLTLQCRTQGEFDGGRLSLETADGEVLEEGPISGEPLRRELPASGRIMLTSPAGVQQTHDLINANAPLIALQRELYRGRFLRKWPDLKPGELPVEAWRLDDYEQAMQHLELTL